MEGWPGRIKNVILLGAMSLAYRLVEPGGRLHYLEVVPFYLTASVFFTLDGEWGDAILALWQHNAYCQCLLFLSVVMVPCFVTGHMSYVDIGWPVGLVVLATNVFLYGSGDGDGNGTRSTLVALALFLHGFRMALGALVLFFPYVWKEDLSRYVYAQMLVLAAKLANNPILSRHPRCMLLCVKSAE